MKRLLIAMLILLAPCATLAGTAQVRAMLGMWGADGSSGTVYTDCSNIGTAAFYYNADHTSGGNYGCKNSTTTIAGAGDSPWVSVVSTSDPGTASPESAGKVSKGTTTASLLKFAITSNDIFSSAEGSISADVYLSSLAGSNYILSEDSGADFFYVYIDGDGIVIILHRGGGGASTVSLFSSATVSANTWTNIQVRWSASNNKISVKVGGNAWQDDADGDAVTAFSSAPAELVTAKAGTSFYLDNLKVYTTSGY